MNILEKRYYARYKQRDPDPGLCLIHDINWDAKTLQMSNGSCRYFPSFDDVVIVESPEAILFYFTEAFINVGRKKEEEEEDFSVPDFYGMFEEHVVWQLLRTGEVLRKLFFSSAKYHEGPGSFCYEVAEEVGAFLARSGIEAGDNNLEFADAAVYAAVRQVAPTWIEPRKNHG